MSSILRALFLVLHAAAIASLVGISAWSTPALASPLPLPLPLLNAYTMDLAQRTDLTSRMSDGSSHHDHNVTLKSLLADHGSASSAHSSSVSTHKRQADSSVMNNFDMLSSYSAQMNQNANIIHGMASEPASERAANADFSEQYLTELSSFNTNFRGFQSVLATLAADKGLANYNKNDQLETLLKGTVNAVKDILGDTYEAIESIPGIGPLLGPTVYDIKCIIDEVLDATENLTDAIINDLVPLLRDLLGQATSTACEAGVEIVGLCLPL